MGANPVEKENNEPVPTRQSDSEIVSVPRPVPPNNVSVSVNTADADAEEPLERPNAPP